MNWLKLGSFVAPFVVTTIVSVALGVLVFRRYISPSINEALAEAQTTITNLAKLAGVKKQDYWDESKLEAVITKEILTDKMPELELLKLALSPSSWEQVEEMIEENPKIALQLYEKYAPLLGQTSQKKIEYHY